MFCYKFNYVDSIIILENYGLDLNLKDFSKQFSNDDLMDHTTVPINSPYVNVTLQNKTPIVVKKSSLCWLFEQTRDRVGSDRLMAVY